VIWLLKYAITKFNIKIPKMRINNLNVLLILIILTIMMISMITTIIIVLKINNKFKYLSKIYKYKFHNL
jgi:hypothetical protein